MFSQKATKIDEIFTVDLTICTMCQIAGEDFVNFCGLLRKHELYMKDPKIQYQRSLIQAICVLQTYFRISI